MADEAPGRRRSGGSPRDVPPATLLVAALDHIADGILLVDPSGVIAYVSAQIGELFGYAPGELLGRKVEVLVPKVARPTHRRERAAYQQHPHVRDMGSGLPLAGVRKDGSTIPLDIRLGVLEGTDLVVASVRDVSAHRRTEADLAVERAERAVVAERERIGRALHDLVIQRLFGIAATLVGVSGAVDERSAGRLQACVDYIDDTIEAIRQSVLDHPGAGDGVAELQAELQAGHTSRASGGYTSDGAAARTAEHRDGRGPERPARGAAARNGRPRSAAS